MVLGSTGQLTTDVSGRCLPLLQSVRSDRLVRFRSTGRTSVVGVSSDFAGSCLLRSICPVRSLRPCRGMEPDFVVALVETNQLDRALSSPQLRPQKALLWTATVLTKNGLGISVRADTIPDFQIMEPHVPLWSIAFPFLLGISFPLR